MPERLSGLLAHVGGHPLVEVLDLAEERVRALIPERLVVPGLPLGRLLTLGGRTVHSLASDVSHRVGFRAAPKGSDKQADQSWEYQNWK